VDNHRRKSWRVALAVGHYLSIATVEALKRVVSLLRVLLGVLYRAHALVGWNGGVLGVGLAMVGNRLPQLIELARYRGAIGVSLGAWSLGVCCSSMWVDHYVGFHL
jgi:small basic protein